MNKNVFVYGSLKKGFFNHYLLKNAKFVCNATLTNFCLIDLGAFPCAIHRTGFKIQGEVYEIDKGTEKALDRLEGYGQGLYDKIDVEVNFTLHPEKFIDAFIYFANPTNKVFDPYIQDKKRLIVDGIWKK